MFTFIIESLLPGTIPRTYKRHSVTIIWIKTESMNWPTTITFLRQRGSQNFSLECWQNFGLSLSKHITNRSLSMIVSMQKMSWVLPSWAPYCEWESSIEKNWACDRNVISSFKANSERLIIFSKVNVWICICLTSKPRLCPRQMSSSWGNEIVFLICRLPSQVTLYFAPLEETKNGRRMVAGQRRHQDVLVTAKSVGIWQSSQD